MYLSIVAMIDDFDRYLRKLYEMSEGQMTIFDRYEIAGKLGLDDDETDEIVDELEDLGKVKTLLNRTVVLSRELKICLTVKKELLDIPNMTMF